MDFKVQNKALDSSKYVSAVDWSPKHGESGLEMGMSRIPQLARKSANTVDVKVGLLSVIMMEGLVKEKVHEYDAVLSNLIQEFDRRFEDVRHNTADFELFAQPFTISVDAVRDDLQMELIDLQCDSELKHKFTSLPLTDFYKCVPANRYPKMCKQAQVMLSLFGSTYLCEQTFSLMNLNKSKLRSKLTDSHLQNILSVSQLQPNLEKLLKNKDQFDISH
ncbi:GTD2A protein, partial [Polypterus senegalus]